MLLIALNATTLLVVLVYVVCLVMSTITVHAFPAVPRCTPLTPTEDAFLALQAAPAAILLVNAMGVLLDSPLPIWFANKTAPTECISHQVAV